MKAELYHKIIELQARWFNEEVAPFDYHEDDDYRGFYGDREADSAMDWFETMYAEELDPQTPEEIEECCKIYEDIVRVVGFGDYLDEYNTDYLREKWSKEDRSLS